jgi:hypothetical protein
MITLFDEKRHYQPCDPEIISLLGNETKQAQMRHHKRSPSYYRLGRKIIYHGADLNAWAQANKVETDGGAA